MPGWEDDDQLGGEGGGGTVIGPPADAFFTESEYGIKLTLSIARSHPELFPNLKPEVSWTYSIAGQKERDNWSILDNGMRVVHAEGKKINAASDLGKLFKSVKEHLPFVEGFDVTSAESWRGLSVLGDIEWGWIEEPKRKEVPDGKGGMKWVDDPDKEPKRTMVVIGYPGTGNGTAPAPLPTVFDITAIPAELLPALVDAAKAADGGDSSVLAAKILAVPGAGQVQAVMTALSKADTAEGLREALVGY